MIVCSFSPTVQWPYALTIVARTSSRGTPASRAWRRVVSAGGLLYWRLARKAEITASGSPAGGGAGRRGGGVAQPRAARPVRLPERVEVLRGLQVRCREAEGVRENQRVAQETGVRGRRDEQGPEDVVRPARREEGPELGLDLGERPLR